MFARMRSSEMARTAADEYENFIMRMNSPRVVIDNGACSTSTIVKVDSSWKRRALLDAVELITADLDLSIRKAYISSDGRWFMDVFHVTDRNGRKLADADKVLTYIEESLLSSSSRSLAAVDGVTVLELTGTDRPGLLSEISAVLRDLCCSVVDAKLWTHNGRMASIFFLRDAETEAVVEDEQKLRLIEKRLRHVLKREHDERGASVRLSDLVGGGARADRRLHQLMLDDRDYEGTAPQSAASLSVKSWEERGYSVVCVQCCDRPKLLFDVVCALTDLGYIVSHGTVDTDLDQASLEFYLKHSDGSPIRSEEERQRLVQCLQAAIKRRASEGRKLELCTSDRQGLLAEVTRIFRENGLSVTRAEVSTKGRTAVNLFYVTDATGRPAEPKSIDTVMERMGTGVLKVSEEPRPWTHYQRPAQEESGGRTGLFSLGNLVRRNLYNLGLIKSCS